MIDDSLSEGPVEAQLHRSAFKLLLTHACWPTPPAAWGHLFNATAALAELHDPAPPHSGGRMKAAGLRLMVRLLDEAHRGLDDHRQIRAFLPLVRGRSKSVDSALFLARERLLSGDVRTGQDGAARILEQLEADATDRMLRGLTKGIGEDQADEERPDLAADLRNPYELATQVDRIMDLLTCRLADLLREGDPDIRFMDRLAVLVPLAEASAELRGTKGIAPAELRIRKTDETLMRVLEAIGPDLVPAPVKSAVRPDPTERRRGLPGRKGPAISDTHNPYRMIQHVGHRSRALGDSLNRLRDHVRSVLAGDIVPMGRRRVPVPEDVNALARTLRRIQAGA